MYKLLKLDLTLVAIEFSERLSFSGIASSLVLYLTKVIHQDLKTAVKNANYVAGFTTLTALLGGFLADAYKGDQTSNLFLLPFSLSFVTLIWHFNVLKVIPAGSSSGAKKVFTGM
ncbi:Putative peptide/nitrate transporter [Glycine soja]|uniref:Putative peptide/nitrate transporter n=1 Tax=Glycine soja TaxID=3848 RepID=A0A0B2PVX4_GLYSO|nr:Putative peptide/nitrate transporter [Glycine soja]